MGAGTRELCQCGILAVSRYPKHFPRAYTRISMAPTSPTTVTKPEVSNLLQGRRPFEGDPGRLRWYAEFRSRRHVPGQPYPPRLRCAHLNCLVPVMTIDPPVIYLTCLAPHVSQFRTLAYHSSGCSTRNLGGNISERPFEFPLESHNPGPNVMPGLQGVAGCCAGDAKTMARPPGRRWLQVILR